MKRPLLTIVFLALVGCTSAPEPTEDVFVDVAGKADGDGFFDEGDPFTVTFDGEDELLVEGRGRRARYRDVEVTAYSAGVRVRLDRGDTLAGMRSFWLLVDDIDEVRRHERIYAAADVVAPRATAVQFFREDTAGPETVLYEHIGDRFTQRHFDVDADLEPDGVVLPLARYAEYGRRGLDYALALKRTARFLAASRAVPIESYTWVLTASGRVPVPNKVSETTPPDLLAALSLPNIHARYVDTLEDLTTCLRDPACGDDDARAAELQYQVDRERAGDAATGDDAYLSLEPNDDQLTVRFRNVYAAPFPIVESVVADILVAGASADSVELRFDDALDLFVGELALPDEVFTLRYGITDIDGEYTEEQIDDVDPSALDQLIAVDTFRLPVGEPSGLSIDPDGMLFVVGDESDDLYVVNAEGEGESTLDLDVRGMEGIAYDSMRDRILVVDEDRGALLEYDPNGPEQTGSRRFDWAEGMAGLEGLTIDGAGSIVFVKERDPAIIAWLEENGDDPEALSGNVEQEEIDFADDLSAVAYNAADGRLYVLSDQEQRLFRLARDEVRPTASWEIPVEKPEGLTFYEDRVYIVDDARGELHVFELGSI